MREDCKGEWSRLLGVWPEVRSGQRVRKMAGELRMCDEGVALLLVRPRWEGVARRCEGVALFGGW